MWKSTPSTRFATCSALCRASRSSLSSMNEKSATTMHGRTGRICPRRRQLCTRRRGEVERRPSLRPFRGLSARELRRPFAPIWRSKWRQAPHSNDRQSLPVSGIPRHLPGPRHRLSRSGQEREAHIRHRLHRARRGGEARRGDPFAALDLLPEGGTDPAGPASRTETRLVRRRSGGTGPGELRPSSGRSRPGSSTDRTSPSRSP